MLVSCSPFRAELLPIALGDTLMAIPPRPVDDEEILLLNVATYFQERLSDWLDLNNDTMQPADVVADLTLALRSEAGANGYRIARFLDQTCKWPRVDAELVAALDGARSIVDVHHRAAVVAWVVNYGIAANFPVGARVNFLGATGVITAIDSETAEYYFMSDEKAAQLKITLERLTWTPSLKSSFYCDKVPVELLDAVCRSPRT